MSNQNFMHIVYLFLYPYYMKNFRNYIWRNWAETPCISHYFSVYSLNNIKIIYNKQIVIKKKLQFLIEYVKVSIYALHFYIYYFTSNIYLKEMFRRCSMLFPSSFLLSVLHFFKARRSRRQYKYRTMFYTALPIRTLSFGQSKTHRTEITCSQRYSVMFVTNNDQTRLKITKNNKNNIIGEDNVRE